MRRAALITFASLIAAAWAVCAYTFLADGGGAYDVGLFAALLTLAIGMTAIAGITHARAWTKGSRSTVTAAGVVSCATITAVVLLSIAISSRG